MEQVDTPAPAPIDAPEPVSALDHAVMEGDQAAYKESRRAERAGTPLPAIAKTPEKTDPPPPAPAPDRELSKRQQEANERTRLAVERATADYRARIAELEARVPTQQDPTPAPAPTKADHKRFLALPDAPKLDAFESVEEYSAAMAMFIADKRYEERDATARQQQEETQSAHARLERDAAFQARLAEVTTAEPEFWNSISPDVLSLKPFDALAAGERPTARNAIAEEILRSPYGPQLMRHLTDHPEELARLSRLGPGTLPIELGELRATFKQAKQPPPVPHNTISRAPEPPTTLGTRTTVTASDEEKAVRAGDQAAFKANHLRERTVTFRGR